MKILCTGSTGFIGTYLVDKLVEEGFDVVSVGRSREGEEFYKENNIPFVKIDLRNEKEYEKLPKDVDAVAHIAGLLSIDMYKPEDYFLTNTLSTYYLCEYCRKNNVNKIVYSMTHSDVNRAPNGIITEETPELFAGPTTPYIVSKIASKKIIESYDREYGIKGIILRLPGVRGYGARFVSFWDGTPEISVFRKFIGLAMKGEPIEIWGEHKALRDCVYVKDVVNGFIGSIISNKSSGLYNIGSGIGLTIEDEAKAIIKAFSDSKKPSPLKYRPDIDEVRKRTYIFSIDKAKRDFGYEPKYSYLDAMKDYHNEMRSGRFKHLVTKQEKILLKRFNLTLDELVFLNLR